MLYLKWIVNKDLLYSTWDSAQCYLAAWMGGQFRREWINVYIWLSPFAVHRKLSQHCLLLDTPIQNKKFKYIYTYIYPKIQSITISNCYGFQMPSPMTMSVMEDSIFTGMGFISRKKYYIFFLAFLYLSQWL